MRSMTASFKSMYILQQHWQFNCTLPTHREATSAGSEACAMTTRRTGSIFKLYLEFNALTNRVITRVTIDGEELDEDKQKKNTRGVESSVLVSPTKETSNDDEIRTVPFSLPTRQEPTLLLNRQSRLLSMDTQDHNQAGSSQKKRKNVSEGVTEEIPNKKTKKAEIPVTIIDSDHSDFDE